MAGDNEDDDRDDEIEAFEHNYNFRYEEGKNASYITTHSREVPDSVRIDPKSDKRKEQRDNRKERKEQEKRRKL